MSLIRTRRERKEAGGGPTRPPSLWKLAGALILVLVAIWWLNRFLGS